MTDTLFADVSEYQVPVNNSYPYRVLSIRVCDGTYRDRNFAHNYRWMRSAFDSGRLTFGIVYTYARPNWWANANTVRSMIDAVRIIGYANAYDFFNMWRVRPAGLRVIGAGYGSNPNLPGQVAHQYTDGSGYSPNLPQGAPPFGRCDMNSANGLTPQQFAAACGVTTTGGPLMALTDEEQTELLTKVREIWDQLRGPNGAGWPQLGQNEQGQDLTPVDAIAVIKNDVAAMLAE